MAGTYYWDESGRLKYMSGGLERFRDALGIGYRKTADPTRAKAWYKHYDWEDPIDYLKTEDTIQAEIAPYLNSTTGLDLTESQWATILSDHYLKDDVNGIGDNSKYFIDIERLQADTDAMLEALAYYENEKPLLENYLADARAQIAAENATEFAELDRLLGQQQDLYNAELKGLGDSYDLARSNLLSQQYQQNSQLMDTLQSGMERSRRNALEAGASAGIRIADNINTLLSVQNKQSATSMETANQLSQMMINQRNAEAATRRDYSSYLQSDNTQRSNLRLSAEDRANSLANTNYQAADQAYEKKKQEFDDANVWNPMYTYLKNNSKYSGGT